MEYGSVNPVRVVGYPQSYVISLEEAKRHLRVEHGDEDELILSLIESAQDYLRLRCERSLVVTDYQMDLCDWPSCEEIVLAYPPVAAVAVRYYPTTGSITTFSSYRLISRSDCHSMIVLNNGSSWPSLATRPDAVQITYTAGHQVIPPAAKHAVKLLVGHWYESREAVATGTSKAIEFSLDALTAMLDTGRYVGA